MSKYQYILFDADDTLLDFSLAQDNAIRKVFSSVGINATQEDVSNYDVINKTAWVEFEKGLLSKDEVLTIRFDRLFKLYGINVDSHVVEEQYRDYLEEGYDVIEHTNDVCKYLSQRYKLYIVTNGVKRTQSIRLSCSGIQKYFTDVFISEEYDVNKPNKEFFEIVFGKIGCFDKSKYVIIGDSLTSDIQGGINAGIDTIWFNRKGIVNDLKVTPTQEIRCLNELISILTFSK